MSRTLLVLSALAAALLALSGCAGTTVGPRTGLPPFIESTPDASDYSIRPLFRYHKSQRLDRLQIDYLFPFGLYRRDGREVENHLYPLFQYMRRVDDDGFEKLDWMASPLVLGGDHGAEGSYLTVLPFGGTLRGALGKEYIVSVLFPLFAYTKLHDYENYHILFPLISWTAGAGHEGWRFLPFYAHSKKTNENGVVLYDRHTVLWPFVTWEENNSNEHRPWTAWAVFPFIGHSDSPRLKEWTFLFPFFKYKRDLGTGINELHAPFPFVWIAWGKSSRFDIWPLGGYINNDDGAYTRWFFLWPIFRSQHLITDEIDETDSYALPVYWNFERDYKNRKAVNDTIARDSQFKIWPLFRVARRVDGRFGVESLSLFWFREDNRFEEIVSPFFQIFCYKEDGEGKRDLRLLFNIFRKEWMADEAPKQESSWELLGGLVGHRSRPEGGTVKVFWIFEF